MQLQLPCSVWGLCEKFRFGSEVTWGTISNNLLTWMSFHSLFYLMTDEVLNHRDDDFHIGQDGVEGCLRDLCIQFRACINACTNEPNPLQWCVCHLRLVGLYCWLPSCFLGMLNGCEFWTSGWGVQLLVEVFTFLFVLLHWRVVCEEMVAHGWH
jgi:hypothetical protein